MYQAQNIFIYQYPQVPDKIRIVVRCVNKETGEAKSKEYLRPFEDAVDISRRSWELMGNDHWECSPYLFYGGSIGYHLSRK
jgi:hypothetical protein